MQRLRFRLQHLLTFLANDLACNQVDIGELFERLQVSYSRLEEKRVAFQKQVEEQSTPILSLPHSYLV